MKNLYKSYNFKSKSITKLNLRKFLVDKVNDNSRQTHLKYPDNISLSHS